MSAAPQSESRRRHVPRGSWIGPLAVLLAVGYPLAVYFGRERVGTRALGVLALGLVTAHALWTLARGRRSSAAAEAARLAPLALLWAAAVLFDEERLLMLAPALGSIALGLVFAGSLRPGVESWIERFARVGRGLERLPPTAVRHCRRVTRLWAGFLVANGLVNAALALWAPVAWWALWAGGLSYAATGLLLVGEYAYRTWRVAPIAEREERELGLVRRPRGDA